jgi:DNA repair protein RadD
VELRDYQLQAVKSIYDYYGAGKTGNAIVVLPTGAGKSIVIAELIKSAMMADRGQRFLMLTHVRELIAQNHEKLMALWPTAPAGIYSAGLKRKQSQMPIVFAGIQSVYKKAKQLGHRDLILIDECHLLSNEAEGRYHTLIEAMLEINPKLKIIGLSATPYRMKGGHLTNGKIFTDICYDYPVYKLIERGYLSPVLCTAPEGAQANLSKVHTVAGDYNQKEMQSAFMDDGMTERAIEDVFRRAKIHRCFLFFCAGVEHATHTHQLLRARGLRGAVVSDKTPMDERDAAIAALRSGQYDYLCNNAVLTTGTDIPRIDCVVLLRSTKSRSLYVQMVGRGMRIAEGKTHCLLLDYGTNVERFGAIDLQPTSKAGLEKSEGETAAPFKICKTDILRFPLAAKACNGVNHPKATCCQHCDAEFIKPKLHDDIAGQGVVISPPLPEVLEVEVHNVEFSKHLGAESGKETMRITYYSATSIICSEFMGVKRAYHQLKEWYDKWPNPQNVDELVMLIKTDAFTYPARIRIMKKGKYWEVLNYDFATKQTLFA